MPELRIEENSPNVRIEFKETPRSAGIVLIINRPGRKPIDWTRCKAKGKGDINRGKAIKVEMPERP